MRPTNEEMKSEKERGFYRHPELYNAPAEKSTMWAHFPQAMSRTKAGHSLQPAPVHSPLAKAATPAKP